MTVQDEIRAHIEQDAELARLRARFETGKATYADTSAYSSRAGKLLGEILSRRLPDIPPEEREALCVELLHDRYIDINKAVDTVQQYMDEAQGLHLASQRAPYNEERSHQIGSSLRDVTKPIETLQRRARAATETATKAVHDDRMEAEARFRDRAGLRCYITRETVGQTCAWCRDVAGRYVYGREPRDVFGRHDNCDCTVIFQSGRQRQDVWSKRTWERPAPDAGAEEPTVFSREEAEAVLESRQAGLTSAGERGIITQGHFLRLDMQFFARRNSEDMPTIWLPKQEYVHVMSEVATNITKEQMSQQTFSKAIGDHVYTFENGGGFGEWRVIGKEKIK